MKQTNYNHKVGRPKLADDRLKFESIIVCIFIIVMCIAIAFASFKILSIDFNSNNIKASILNDHMNSCVFEGNIIDCGPNIIYLKYKNSDGNYKEVIKDSVPIRVIVDDNQSIEFCYKTKNNDLICNN